MDRPRLYRPSRGLDVAPPLGDPAPPFQWTPSIGSAPDRAIIALHGRGDQDPLPALPGPRNFPPRPPGQLPPPQPPPCGNNAGHHPSTTATTASSNNRRGRHRYPRSARPDLLAQGALPAPTSVPPPTLPPQPPVDDLLDFDE
ncbi:hypothetical protein HPB52_004546 [Rhipicephalus sanguineus]|uniref:Uncharacterized protein n=2 Tax=Rhipicephalus sanguineus TaxID=34632 RepID=A0A9D4STY1_RHISA|nr:hypothetical protein HPB52_004546 [Rhipicephalus sanguineus]